MAPGEWVAINPQLQEPFRVLLCRPLLSNRGSLLTAIEQGAAVIVTPGLSVPQLAAALGRRPRHRVHYGELRLLK